MLSPRLALLLFGLLAIQIVVAKFEVKDVPKKDAQDLEGSLKAFLDKTKPIMNDKKRALKAFESQVVESIQNTKDKLIKRSKEWLSNTLLSMGKLEDSMFIEGKNVEDCFKIVQEILNNATDKSNEYINTCVEVTSHKILTSIRNSEDVLKNIPLDEVPDVYRKCNDNILCLASENMKMHSDMLILQDLVQNMDSWIFMKQTFLQYKLNKCYMDAYEEIQSIAEIDTFEELNKCSGLTNFTAFNPNNTAKYTPK